MTCDITWMVASSQLVSLPLCQILSVFWIAMRTPCEHYSGVAHASQLLALGSWRTQPLHGSGVVHRRQKKGPRPWPQPPRSGSFVTPVGDGGVQNLNLKSKAPDWSVRPTCLVENSLGRGARVWGFGFFDCGWSLRLGCKDPSSLRMTIRGWWRRGRVLSAAVGVAARRRVPHRGLWPGLRG